MEAAVALAPIVTLLATAVVEVDTLGLVIVKVAPPLQI